MSRQPPGPSRARCSTGLQLPHLSFQAFWEDFTKRKTSPHFHVPKVLSFHGDSQIANSSESEPGVGGGRKLADPEKWAWLVLAFILSSRQPFRGRLGKSQGCQTPSKGSRGSGLWRGGPSILPASWQGPGESIWQHLLGEVLETVFLLGFSRLQTEKSDVSSIQAFLASSPRLHPWGVGAGEDQPSDMQGFAEDGQARAKRFMKLNALLIDPKDLQSQLLCRQKGGYGNQMAN